MPSPVPSVYRGRIAPSPTGYLHLGHAATFRVAQERALARHGTLLLRVEDIDEARCKPEFRTALIEDLLWAGFQWSEGPDCGGPFAPYIQSERRAYYRAILDTLRQRGYLYPCRCSRREIQQIASAPHAGDEEPLYPGTCRPQPPNSNEPPPLSAHSAHSDHHWRFRVPEGEPITYHDAALGPQTAIAGVDFGDFVVWRRDDVPAYQLAVVADDHAMQITEVVRGQDLLLSTFRQLLLYRALDWEPPAYYHAPLLLDPQTGERLAKRHAALSLRQLRAEGRSPASLWTPP